MNILNEDVAEWNFVVTEASDVDQVDNQGEPVKPHLWMIDLAMCRTRGVDESDGDWFRDKHHSNEEVFAGTMKNILKAYHDFDLNFKLTLQYLKYGDKFCDGCDGNLVRYNPFALISRSYGQSSIPR